MFVALVLRRRGAAGSRNVKIKSDSNWDETKASGKIKRKLSLSVAVMLGRVGVRILTNFL